MAFRSGDRRYQAKDPLRLSDPTFPYLWFKKLLLNENVSVFHYADTTYGIGQLQAHHQGEWADPFRRSTTPQAHRKMLLEVI